MYIANLRWKPLDKLLLLWTVSLIHYKQERKESISYRAIKDEFGEDGILIFQTYVNAAVDQNMLDYEHMQLTPKGLAICEKWKQINEKLYQF